MTGGGGEPVPLWGEAQGSSQGPCHHPRPWPQHTQHPATSVSGDRGLFGWQSCKWNDRRSVT